MQTAVICPSLNFQICIYTTVRGDNLLKRGVTTNLHLHLGEAATEDSTAGAGMNHLKRCCEGPQRKERGKERSREGRRGIRREKNRECRRAEIENRERWRGKKEKRNGDASREKKRGTGREEALFFS